MLTRSASVLVLVLALGALLPLAHVVLWCLAPHRVIGFTSLLTVESMGAHRSSTLAVVVRALRSLLGLNAIGWSRRSTDAWARWASGRAHSAFEALSAVASQVPLESMRGALSRPDGEHDVSLSPEHLCRTYLTSRDARLVLWGEPGLGRSGVAIAIGRHLLRNGLGAGWAAASVPVLIDDLRGLQGLAHAVSRGLLQMLGTKLPLEACRELMRRQNVLVLLDETSEGRPASRALPDVESANLLVAVTRARTQAFGPSAIHIRPLPLSNEQFRAYASAHAAHYVPEAAVRAALEQRMVSHCRLVTGAHSAPVLLVAVVCAHAIADRGPRVELADVVGSYFDRAFVGDPRVRARLLRCAQRLAWVACRSELFPDVFSRKAADAALGSEGDSELDADAVLAQLEFALGLIECADSERSTFRFVRPALCTLLAAQHVIRTFGGDQRAWRRVVEKAESSRTAPPDSGTARAVHLASLLTHDQASVPAEMRARLRAVADEMPGLLGTRVGSYEIEALLGRGPDDAAPRLSYSRYLLRHAEIDRRLAWGRLYATSDLVESDRARLTARVRRHVDVLISLEGHPCVQTFVDFVVDNSRGGLWVIEEAIDGHSLREVRATSGRVPGVAETLVEVLGALDAMHAREIFVRDLPPDSVILPGAGRPCVLTHFELAQSSDGYASVSSSTSFAELPYTAPELRAGETQGTRQGDLYAWAALGHFAFTGAEPDRDLARCAAALRAGDAPEGIVTVLLDCLSPLRSERPPSVAVVQRRLAQALVASRKT